MAKRNQTEEQVKKMFSQMKGHQKGEYVTFGDLEQILFGLPENGDEEEKNNGEEG